MNLRMPLIAVAIVLWGCAESDPGPLAGTWQKGGLLPMTIQFRPGETEALGVIEKVSYEVRGADVIVTYKEGMAKGMAMRYTITGPSTARTEMGTLQRIR